MSFPGQYRGAEAEQLLTYQPNRPISEALICNARYFEYIRHWAKLPAINQAAGRAWCITASPAQYQPGERPLYWPRRRGNGPLSAYLCCLCFWHVNEQRSCKKP